ncbi:M48 family metallopeptidase [Pseudodonghicola xiamenensis]|nr:M48 family metallopeptidase [Pseudodonghicola xiamenensis]
MRWMFLLAALLLTAACDTGGLLSTSEMDPHDQARINSFVEVIQKVEPVAETECVAFGLAHNCNFQIQVDTNPEEPPNAFQSLDRKDRPVITFTMTLIETTQNNDELAFVLAHETSHHILGHLARQAKNAEAGAQILGQMATLDGANPVTIARARQIGAELGARSFSKEYELEADHLGTIIAYEAGFDPLKGAAYFDRLPDPGDQFLGSHPPNAARKKIVLQTMRDIRAAVASGQPITLGTLAGAGG